MPEHNIALFDNKGFILNDESNLVKKKTSLWCKNGHLETKKIYVLMLLHDEAKNMNYDRETVKDYVYMYIYNITGRYQYKKRKSSEKYQKLGQITL